MTIPLAAKLDRLCKLFPTCPELSNYLLRMNDLARLTLDLGGFRHKLIHSNFANFEDGPPLKIHLHVVSHDKDDNMKVESFRPELAHIELMIEQTISLHRELLMPLLEDVQKHQQHREIGRKPFVHL